MSEKIDRNLSLQLIRATEATALASGRIVGRGNVAGNVQGAAEAMVKAFRSLDAEGTIVVGEGAAEEVQHLYQKQAVGNGSGPKMDVAVRAIDGIRLLASGLPHVVSIAALADAGTLYTNPAGIKYMNKIAVGPEAKGAISLDQPVEWNLENIAKAKRIDVHEVTVVVLDRPRNQQIIREVRQAGARLHLITDGDISAALSAALSNTGVDVLMGIGGANEAVITACLLKCLDGDMVCRLYPHNIATRQQALSLGVALDATFRVNDLASGDNIFVSITGITDSEHLEGVRYSEDGVHTHSMVMRSKSGTVRDIRARHRLDKLMRYSEIDFLAQNQEAELAPSN